MLFSERNKKMAYKKFYIRNQTTHVNIDGRHQPMEGFHDRKRKNNQIMPSIPRN